jgi:hypothetical protein
MAASHLKRAWVYFRPGRIETVDELARFLEKKAALIAQKCAIDYCRGKTGLAAYALFTEEPFLKALDVCRWETFVVVLGDLLVIAEGYLRAHVASEARARLSEALIGLYQRAIDAIPRVAHRPHGWGDALETFAERLRSASRDKPQQALDVADHSAKRLFDTLPIHLSLRILDEEVVYGAVRFRMIAVSQEMERRFAADALARQLVA